MDESPNDHTQARDEMVAALTARRPLGDRVAAAMRAVPRHLFLPEIEPQAAYLDQPVVIKRDAGGRPISSSSQPAIMAVMLDQLDVRPGHRVLEIEAGTGYNAALLAHLAGPGGHVVTVDLDADLAERAGRRLAEAGHGDVEVVCADGVEGHAAGAPYDRIIVTAGAWDLAPAWAAQLGPGGRLVVPLDLRGVQASVALERADGRWVSTSVEPCGFMRMRGPSGGPEPTRVLRQEQELMLTLPEPREVGDALGALDGVASEADIGLAGPLSPALLGTDVTFWLALHEPRWCMLSGRERLARLVGHQGRSGYGGTVGVADAGAVAILALAPEPAAEASTGEGAAGEGSARKAEGASGTGAGGAPSGASAPGLVSSVARGFGPGGARLAADLAAHVRAWDAAGRPAASALRVEARPIGEGGDADPEGAPHGASGGAGRDGGWVVLEKRHTRLLLRFT
ncbi:methyltransferase domain-containing protein [Nonomuraea pusilla]|uniref:Protein-L-isoaspartate O-methyltransferase n=1 Tax=Nonomuraea pusilla TaxID=46177 RepID=A0A1H7TL59_9ACTN|nr:methyltransferase domain-containing protein [Nonomuraea pusilla]SEL85229.1 protein-L-isoaspartate(D-aspartate) O-methyltransferase [Nonomuraea pusilla]